MENLKVFMFTFFAVLLLLVFDVNGQLQEPKPQRPLCVSQLALVNYACGSLPPAPPATFLPSSTPVVFPEDDNNHGHRHGNGRHRHRNGHRHRGSHRHSHGGAQEENCCRWLNDLDDECVCELLFRLPPFLSRPQHKYTIQIDGSCSVSYTCGSK